MQKQLLFLFLILLSLVTTAQNKKVLVSGFIFQNDKPLEDVHVFNTNTKQGTFSDEDGRFFIKVSWSDIILISSIGYKNQSVSVTNEVIENKTLAIKLQTEYQLLEEVDITNNHVIGILSSEANTVPKDTIGEMVKKIVEDIKNLDYAAIVNMPIGSDEVHLSKAPAPTIPMHKGAGMIISLGNNKSNKELRKNLSEKQEFPLLISQAFGTDYFHTKLGIPEDQYYHFIDYCNDQELKNLYDKRDFLTLLALLKQESISYLKSLKLQR